MRLIGWSHVIALSWYNTINILPCILLFIVIKLLLLYWLVWCGWSSHWSRREEADFYRVVSTFGVERDWRTMEFRWAKFRALARLDKKHDDTLTEYFRAFYHMCLTVCRRVSSDDNSEWIVSVRWCSAWLTP